MASCPFAPRIIGKLRGDGGLSWFGSLTGAHLPAKYWVQDFGTGVRIYNRMLAGV